MISLSLSKMQKTMKKNYILGTLAVAALALVSCQKEQEIEITVEPKGVPFEFVAGTVDTKTVNAGLSTTWAADDQICLFHAVKDAEASTAVYDGAFTASAAGASVAFTGTIADALDGETSYDWYAIYPYSDGVKTANAFNYVTIGSAAAGAQVQAGNDSKAHLAGTNYPLWGKQKNVAAATKPALTMNQMASIIEVKVTNKTAVDTKVTKVQFSSTADAELVGEFSVDLSGNTPAFTASTTNSVATLNVIGADALAEDEYASFFFAVKPFTATVGSKLTITVTTDQGTQELSNIVPANFSFVAGKIHTLNLNFTNVAGSIAEFKYDNATWLTAQSIALPAGGADTELTGTTQTVAPITLSSTDGSTTTRVHGTAGTPVTYDLRVYKNGGSFTLSADDEYVINKVTLVGSSIAGASVVPNVGTYTTASTTWTGFTQDVKFTNNNGDRFIIKSINVFYRAATASDHILYVPVRTFDVAYDATTTDIAVRKLNISDLQVTSDDAAFTSYSTPDATTIRVVYTANAAAAPRNIVIHVKSVSAGFDEDVTIAQAGAPTKINTLTAPSTGVTVTAKVTALTTKGFILTDDTASIFVYTNSDITSTYTIGQTVTVAGDVSTNNLGLQFNASGSGSATVTPGAAGSYVYPSATVKSLSDIEDYIADGSNRLATFIQYSGVVPSSPSSYLNVCVGGVAVANTGSYNIPSTLVSGFSKGDFVTVKGYAMSVNGGRMTVCVTSITKDDDVPALVYNNISGISGEGVGSTDLTITPYRVTGWTPSLVSKPSWVTSVTPAADCTKISYVVEENGTTERSGNIVIRITKEATSYDYTIKITQDANLPKTTFTFSTIYSAVESGGNCDISTDTQDGITLTYKKNDGTQPKYYYSGSAIRLYNKNTLEISGGTKKIKKVVFNFGSDKGTWSVETGGGTLGDLSGSTRTWTASSDVTSVSFKTTSTARISSLVITYQN